MYLHPLLAHDFHLLSSLNIISQSLHFQSDDKVNFAIDSTAHLQRWPTISEFSTSTLLVFLLQGSCKDSLRESTNRSRLQCRIRVVDLSGHIGNSHAVLLPV
jgi:hypothetical protein